MEPAEAVRHAAPVRRLGALFEAGLALVGPHTTLREVRSQLIDAHDEEGESEGDGAWAGREGEAAREISRSLGAGRFGFLAGGSRSSWVGRQQEPLVRGSAISDPVTIQLGRHRAGRPFPPPDDALSRAGTAPAEPESGSRADEAPVRDEAVKTSVKALIAAGTRRQADALELNAVLRDCALAASLRRHAKALTEEAAEQPTEKQRTSQRWRQAASAAADAAEAEARVVVAQRRCSSSTGREITREYARVRESTRE